MIREVENFNRSLLIMPFYNTKNNFTNFAISFSRTPRDDFGIFAKGYFEAASKLAEILLSKNHFSDDEAYPVVFLYRHSLELYLKNIIYRAVLLSALKGLNDIDTRLYNNHRVATLAGIAGRILVKVFPHDTDLALLSKKITKIASEFEQIDPDSYSYRYPIDIKGNPSTKHNQIVNLESMSCTMNELLDELETIDFGISIETDVAQEIYEIMKSV
jgi:hypothetical protein